jgi:hypothetical protein
MVARAFWRWKYHLSCPEKTILRGPHTLYCFLPTYVFPEVATAGSYVSPAVGWPFWHFSLLHLLDAGPRPCHQQQFQTGRRKMLVSASLFCPAGMLSMSRSLMRRARSMRFHHASPEIASITAGMDKSGATATSGREDGGHGVAVVRFCADMTPLCHARGQSRCYPRREPP